MNVNPCRAHDSHVVTIHRVGRDGKTGTGAERLPRAALGAWRAKLARNVLERQGVMAQLQNNASVWSALLAGYLHLDRREVALADRVVRILPNVRLGAAGCFIAGAVSGLGSVIPLVLAHFFETDAQSQAVADGMSMAGIAMLGLSLTGAVCAMGAARLSDRQWAQIQTERDRLRGITVEQQEEDTALSARALDLKQAEDTLVRHVTRHVTRHDVEQETGMPMDLVNLVVGYLADEDLPRPSLPALTGS